MSQDRLTFPRFLIPCVQAGGEARPHGAFYDKSQYFFHPVSHSEKSPALSLTPCANPRQ